MIARMVTTVLTFLVGTVGVNLRGAEILTVRGRKSGKPRSLVVNPLGLGDDTFLVSARGESSWVKNMRAVEEGQLRRGRRIRSFTATELEDDEKLPVMRAYLKTWGWQVKSFMGVDGKSSDEDIRAILPTHPVFRLVINDE
jgi:deazaflavin-dependent oxidoreductase (nitroreductase family)